jgi:hypothetical protein
MYAQINGGKRSIDCISSLEKQFYGSSERDSTTAANEKSSMLHTSVHASEEHSNLIDVRVNYTPYLDK